MSRRPFDIEDIFIGERHRNPDMKKVEEIARSISDVGLLNAPAVCMRNDVAMPDGEVCDSAPVLIFGRHRLMALKSLGHTVVECEVYEVDDLRAELMEIDENLARSELSPAEEASHIRRRQEIWKKLQSDGNRSIESKRGDGRGHRPKEFASELSELTGDSKTQINVKIARARELGPDIQRIVGTSLDKGVEMDALMSLPADKREELISQAELGEKVSARTTSDPVERKARQRQMFWDMWAKLDDDVRQELSAVIVAQHKD
jgi:hypothetical protein